MSTYSWDEYSLQMLKGLKTIIYNTFAYHKNIRSVTQDFLGELDENNIIDHLYLINY